MSVCVSNVKQIGLAIKMYATDYGGDYPLHLSALSPAYAGNLSAFLCPSKAYASHLSDKDVLRDFAICYEYTPGLTEKSNPDSILVVDRPGNHTLGHHKGARTALFVDGRVMDLFAPSREENIIRRDGPGN